jgi:hypothetical protein
MPCPDQIERDLLRSLVLGLHWEYARTIQKSPELIRQRVSTSPNILLIDMGKLGIADPQTWTIQLNSTFAATHRFDAVRDVFLHEVAHLWASVYPEGTHETSHGPIFRAMSELLGADPHATGKYSPLFSPKSKTVNNGRDPQDQLRAKVHKLLSLAQSPYPKEARAAASKASELIARHNLALIEEDRERSFTSRFMCDPAKRHPRHICVVSIILKRFFFVEIVWIPAWVVSQKCAGNVPEMSGQPHDIEFASYVFNFIQGTIRAQWGHARKQHGFSGREFQQFALGVANGFYSRLEEDRRALSARMKAERNVAKEAVRSGSKHAGTDLVNVADPKLSDYIKRRYGKMRSIGRPSRPRKSSYYVGKKVGKQLVLHRGIEATSVTSRLMLTE